MKYRVTIADNFHYMDEEERYRSGEFATLEDAIAHCRAIVDEFLDSAFEPGNLDELIRATDRLAGK